MEMERILSASGPTGGHLVRPSDHKEPKKIAWFQCVGSRDLNRCDNAYCSSVCCMYAIKEAVIAKEHAGDDLDCAVFFMDMRTHGKDFERFYDNAREKQGVRFVRSRVHTVDPVAGSDELELRYVTEDGELVVENFDMVVLSVGLQTDPEVVELAKKLGIELTAGNFCKTDSFAPVATSREGIYVCGAFQGPKDIPQSVVDASAAASAAGEILSPARNTATKMPEVVPETNVVNERPRIGVFVCRCGINIAGVVDVPSVAEYAKTLPYVEYATDNLYSCSQDTQETMATIIKQKKLNRVVVAACTPKTHEPLFQETLINAGLNKYLFEMCNIRNQDSWVHKNAPGRGHDQGQGPGAHGGFQGGPDGAARGGRAGDQPDRHGHRRRAFRHGGGQEPGAPGLRDPRDRKKRPARRPGPNLFHTARARRFRSGWRLMIEAIEDDPRSTST